MGLTLIIGSPASGKTQMLIQGLVSAAERQQPVLVLPSGPDVRRAEHDLACAGVMGVRSITLERWVEELWSLHGDGRRIIGPAARAAVVAELLHRSDLEVLERSGRTPGFADLVADLVKRFDETLEGRRFGTVGEVAGLIHEYERELESRGLVEAVRAQGLIARKPPRLDGPIGVNRFTDLTPGQERLLVGLAQSNEVTVALPWVRGKVASAALTPLIERFENAGARCVECAAGGSGDLGLDRLQAVLFEEGERPMTTDALVMGEASGGEAECALVALHARRAMDSGVAPEDIAVAFRDVASRRAPLLAALRTHDVPVVFDISLAFSKVPLGAAFLALMDGCAGRGDTRERLLSFLHSPYSGASREAVAALDARWRLRRESPGDILASVAQLEGVRATVSTARALVSAKTVVEDVSKWEYLATRLLLNALSLRGASDIESALDAAAHRALLRAVSEVASAGGAAAEGDVSQALHSVRVSTAASERAGAVLVTEAHRLQGRRFHTVVLGGLTASEFSTVSRESLAAELLQSLGATAGVEPQLRERMLFHTIVTRPTHRLVLIRQTSDERGEAVRPSVFWEDVLDVYRTADEAAEGVIPEGLEAEQLAMSDLAAAAPAFLPGRRAARADRLRGALTGPRRGRLSVAGRRMIAERDEFSISEIETYLSCPYRWFYQRVLRRRELDREFDARERGSLAHDVMAEFYRMWRESGRGRIDYSDLDEALTLLEEVARASANRAGSVRAVSLADEVSSATAQAWARDMVVDDVTFLPGFVPVHHEFSFGKAAGRPVEICGVALKGSIDRIDVAARGVVAIDYKSSSEVEGRSSFEGKGLLQVPLYASIAGMLLEAPVLGGLYRSFKTRSARGFWQMDEVDLGDRGNEKDALDSAAMTDEIARATSRMSVAVDAMRNGDIEPRPLNARACEHCDARGVCGEAV